MKDYDIQQYFSDIAIKIVTIFLQRPLFMQQRVVATTLFSSCEFKREEMRQERGKL